MSKRKFGAIKSLLHFDYPYFNEPGDGLGDEVGLETWSKEANAALYGAQIPRAGTQAPKFGYRCLYARGAVIGTNNTGIWNLNSSNEYEIEMFIYPKTHGGTRYLFRLESSELLLLLDLTSSGLLRVRASAWGVVDLTGTTIPSTKVWHHILLRVSGKKLTLFLDGAEEISAELPENITIEPTSAKIGYFSSTSYVFYVDEFVFRHAAGKGAPTVPTEPYNGVLDISKVGGFGNGADGSLTTTANVQLNSRCNITAVTDSKTFTVDNWNNGSYTATIGREVMIHLCIGNNPLLGCYTFARIANIESNVITLDREITTENGDDFSLSDELRRSYQVQVITVPNFTSLTVSAGKTVTPCVGGVVAFRCRGDCTINGNIITYGNGITRNDTMQVTHSKLIEHFLYSGGGGIFIACGGTFIAPSTARLGATWSGAGESGGAAGYGGNGGNVNPSASVSAWGGAGGVGGGGGGAACSSTSSSALASGGAAGSTGGSATVGGGGGGCGGNGGTGSSFVGGSGGGGQGGSCGSNGSSKAVSGNAAIGDQYTVQVHGVHGGDARQWDTNSSSNTSYTLYYSGAGGGAPGGNGGKGQSFKSASTDAFSHAGGTAGASIILICNKLNVDNTALSTGGGAGQTRNFQSGYTKIGGSGGGGTGFCYIACNERLSV